MDSHADIRGDAHIRVKTTGMFVEQRMKEKGREDLAGSSLTHPVTGEEATPQPTFMNVALHNHTAPCLPLCAGRQL